MIRSETNKHCQYISFDDEGRFFWFEEAHKQTDRDSAQTHCQSDSDHTHTKERETNVVNKWWLSDCDH